MGHIKAIQSGDIIEIFNYERDLPEKNKRNERIVERSNGICRPRKMRRKIVRDRRFDNVCRQRATFRRLVRSNLTRAETPALLTLTMLDIVPITQGYKSFSDFISRLRKSYGETFRYIAVPEFQKRGAVHFHVLMWGLPYETIYFERQERTLQHIWARGFLDCTTTDGNGRLITYLCKYMQKAVFDERLAGQKGYVCSRNIVRPVLLKTKTQLGEYLRINNYVDNEVTYSKEYDTKWLGSMSYKIIKIA